MLDNTREAPALKRVLFGDTYVKKHYECAMAIVNAMTRRGIVPILTQTRSLHVGIECDCLVYFNKPSVEPPNCYTNVPRILIDHGASNLKWFLANPGRFDFFDVLLTAGEDHNESLLSFFRRSEAVWSKVRAAGFIKSADLLAPPALSRAELASRCGLDAGKEIIFFAPTWHISANVDMERAIAEVAGIENHVASLHPETVHLNTHGLNVVENAGGITTELLKHADCVISDTSSTIFEAAALGKPIVQVLLREYSDNNAVMFDLPYTAGSAHLFCGGLSTRPENILRAVREALDASPEVNQALEACRDRILSGTRITNDACDLIVSELERAMGPEVEARNGAVKAHVDLERVHQNLFFARNLLIAHGGGDFGKSHASNSIEATEAALGAIDLVELDFVRGADGVLVAHDGYEARYGFEEKFDHIRLSDFKEAKFDGHLRPLSLAGAVEMCARKGKALVCDVKGIGDEYAYVCRQIFEAAAAKDALDRVVLQCYRKQDFEFALDAGFRRIILPVWKHFYKDPLGDEAFEFLSSCVQRAPERVVGISIPYVNKHMPRAAHLDPRFARLASLWCRIYVHGAPLSEYPVLLRRNVGLFADAYANDCQFKDHPAAFDWKQYLFLNPGLVEAGVDNQVSAVRHYVRNGRNEGRLTMYQTPGDFIFSEYVDMNPGLRKGGISGADTARAHWTRYGAKEGRKYRRAER